MFGRKHPLIVLVVLALMLCLTVSVSAQGDTLGSLTVGQPVIGQVSAEAPVARYALTVENASTIALQAFGETAQPVVAILRDGELVASANNADGALIVDMSAMLPGGSYVVEVSAANASSGAIILVVQSITPVTINDLVPDSRMDIDLSADSAVALFRLSAMGEPSVIDIQGNQPNSGMVVRLMNETSGSLSGMFMADLIGGRFIIPAGGSNYLVEVEHSGAAAAESFSICWAAASAESCGSSAPVVAPSATEEVAAPSGSCTVTPAGGAVNVRASASIDAPIVATLASGIAADVVGAAPGGFFYNIQLGGVNGWVAASVVNANGDCANVATVQPPQFTPIATQAPAQPTQAPVQPTQAPAQPNEPQQQPPQPTQPPSGPCLLSLNSAVNVYTQPTAQVDFLQDQVQAGGELIPTGRLADGSWWQTNYGGAWVQTGLFGGAITVSGNCNLPVVSFTPPTEAPSGPCLLSLNSAVNVYTQPTAQVDFLQDQVQAGGELIPTGRLADNSWWKTNYGGAWVQTSLFGGAITVSGNCNLPTVSN